MVFCLSFIQAGPGNASWLIVAEVWRLFPFDQRLRIATQRDP